MAFFFLCLTIFIMFFQPVSAWPALGHLQPLRNAAIVALIAYIASPAKTVGQRFFSNRVNLYFLLFVIAQVISSSLLWFSGGIETLNYWLRIGIVYFLIIRLAASENDIRKIILMIVLGLSYLSYYSISTFIPDYTPGIRAGGFGWYENPNDLSIILVTVIPLVLFLANTSKNILTKYLFVGIAGAFAFNILFTGSRNGLLGLLAVVLLSLYFSSSIPRFIRLLLLVCFAGSILTVGMTSIMSRKDLSGSISGDTSSENRLEQWKTGLRMLKDHPIFGIGPGEFTSYVRDYGGIPGMQPHNTLLQVFVETGITGGIFFSLFSFYPLYVIWKMFKNGHKMFFTSGFQFIYSSLTGFWICAFFSNRYQFYILYILIALFVAMLNSIAIPQRKLPHILTT